MEPSSASNGIFSLFRTSTLNKQRLLRNSVPMYNLRIYFGAADSPASCNIYFPNYASGTYRCGVFGLLMRATLRLLKGKPHHKGGPNRERDTAEYSGANCVTHQLPRALKIVNGRRARFYVWIVFSGALQASMLLNDIILYDASFANIYIYLQERKEPTRAHYSIGALYDIEAYQEAEIR